MQKLLDTLQLGQIDPTYQFLIKVAVIVVAAIIANFVLQRVLRLATRKLESKRIPWPAIVTWAISKPLAWLVTAYAIYLCVLLLPDAIIGKIGTQVVGNTVDLVAIFLIGWSLMRMIAHARQVYSERPEIDKTTLLAISRVLQALVLVLMFLTAMQTLGFSVQSVLAVGGIGGVAVGFAAKDLLANFFGGLMIYLDRPFSVGDWVRSPDKQIEGTVEHIGWRLTVIRTFDKRPLYVPNSLFATISVENPSRMTNRRIYETVGLRYDDARQVKPIIDAVRDMLVKHPDIDQNQTMIVNFNAFGASSLDFFIYTFTKTTQWIEYHHIKQDVLLKVMDIIDNHGAEIAFPTSTVLLSGDEPGFAPNEPPINQQET